MRRGREALLVPLLGDAARRRAGAHLPHVGEHRGGDDRHTRPAAGHRSPTGRTRPPAARRAPPRATSGPGAGVARALWRTNVTDHGRRGDAARSQWGWKVATAGGSRSPRGGSWEWHAPPPSPRPTPCPFSASGGRAVLSSVDPETLSEGRDSAASHPRWSAVPIFSLLPRGGTGWSGGGGLRRWPFGWWQRYGVGAAAATPALAWPALHRHRASWPAAGSGADEPRPPPRRRGPIRRASSVAAAYGRRLNGAPGGRPPRTPVHRQWSATATI